MNTVTTYVITRVLYFLRVETLGWYILLVAKYEQLRYNYYVLDFHQYAVIQYSTKTGK